MSRRPILLLVAGCIGGCGSQAPGDGDAPPSAGGFSPDHPAVERGFDPDDPALSLLPQSSATERRLLRRLGHREDFRVPRAVVAPLADGPLAHAVIARIWNELESGESPTRYRRLNHGQRALYVLQWADAEILDGGFSQFWFNDTGYLVADLVPAARRVGSREFEDIFRDAAALFPGGAIPRDRATRQRLLRQIDSTVVARLDDRYFATQYRRRTALALILTRYVKAHPEQFVAG